MLVVCRAAGRRTGGNSLPEYWQLGAKPCARVQAPTCGGRPLPYPAEFLGYGRESDQGACWCVVLEVTQTHIHIHTHSML